MPSLLPDDLSDAFLAAAAGQHQFMAAAAAFQLDIHSHPQDLPGIAPAGMGFFQLYNIVQM
jgi:hypothetical protein